ncbi:hypothetical protein PAXRUDRAFT_35799 [Paxillus rubicundulus Ve08.2h10]|uniref:Retrotransposon gag domain-containing protein n=1 Tax=Paxillus rubicundulus Ve08.2h10 TaxID=930991 RepID=A0A0D0DC21_9AGAM|nr:hypothetical protein PAXRUDRAFT_35799 [Paxillus rubicundulus Ve08.2h10]
MEVLNETIAQLQAQLLAMVQQMQEMTEQKATKEMKFNKKFELVADPGKYEGDKAEFNEWWTKVQTKIDWARATLQNMKQGTSRIDDFITKFLCLVRLMEISDEHGVYLLEQNTKPEVIKQVYITGQRRKTIGEAAFGTQQSVWFNNAKNSSFGSRTYGGHGEPMDVDAMQRGKCFNCRDCKILKNQCSECKWYAGCHKFEYRHSKGKGRDVHVMDTGRSAPSQPNPTSGMDYEAMKAHFYDMHTNELKAQGKDYGH